MNLSYPKVAVLLLAVSFTMSCTSERTAKPSFDGNRAFSYLERQVAFGPRVPGTQASLDCRKFFYEHFAAAELGVDSQAFTYFDPYSQAEVRMVNVIGSHRNANEPNALRIVLMAHYDSRPRTDYPSDSSLREQPIAGANDGASGVAVLLELANLFQQTPPPVNVDLALVDGEDWGTVADHANYMIGSREFSRRNIRGKYRFGIVIDMIGDNDQQIYREFYSQNFAPRLNDFIFETAKSLGLDSFKDSVKFPVQDDHLSLISAGVPAVDLIDFDYPYWHTEFDTVDKCGPQALSNVGRLLVEIIYDPGKWPKEL